VGDALALAFFATCRLAKQFLQAMAGIESMTAAINPADNSLSVVIELPRWMQQTTRDYPSLVERVWLQGTAIVKFLSAASGVHATCILTLGRDRTRLLDCGQSCSKLPADEFGEDTHRDRAVRARIAGTGMKSGMDVLSTAPPFKISPQSCCIRC
jgi:hypothetical protein